jgi:hypothetical protein
LKKFCPWIRRFVGQPPTRMPSAFGWRRGIQTDKKEKSSRFGNGTGKTARL